MSLEKDYIILQLAMQIGNMTGESLDTVLDNARKVSRVTTLSMSTILRDWYEAVKCRYSIGLTTKTTSDYILEMSKSLKEIVNG